MADATINSNVGVNVNPTGMAKAAQDVEQKIQGIVRAIEKAGTAANDQLKALAVGMKQLDTLRSTQGKLAAGDFNSAAGLGRQARALAEYRAGISKTSDAMGVLRARTIALDVANGKLLQSGKVPTKESVLNAQKIEQTTAAYGKLTNQVTGLRGRIALLGDDSKKAFAPMLAQFDKLDKKNAGLFGQSNRINFKPQLDQMQRLTANLTQQVSLTEKKERLDRLNLETVRAQAQQVLNRTRAEREAQLAGAVRGANREFSNSALIGKQDFNRNIDQQARLVRATSAAASAQIKLNAELAKPGAEQNAAAIAKLTAQYERLVAAQGRAIAAQSKVNSEQGKAQGQGGFMAGIKSVGANLFDKPEGSGSAFGAGALVGRVGVYAVASAAIYGVIAALKEAISFSIEFEDQLAKLGAISGSTTMQMERLSAGILQVAKTSATGVIDLTKAATIIAQAGYGGNEITTMLDSVTKLSDASGSSAEDAVDILTGSLGAFQISAGESARVTDALVGALNSSKLSISQVQLGIQYLGATAKTNNISLNELVAMLGVMADAGIRGSTAATGLRQMFIEMIDPSKKMVEQLDRVGLTTSDIDVKTLGAVEVLNRLKHSGFDAYSAMETRAAAAYVAISSNIDGIGELEAATLRQGAAAEAQSTRIASTSARWQMMLNVLAELASEIGTNLGPAMRGIITILEAMAVVLLAPIVIISKLIKAISDLIVGTETVALSQEKFTDALMETGAAASTVAELNEYLGDSFEDLETLTSDLESRYDSLKTEQASLRDETGKLILRQDVLGASNASVANQVNLLASRFPGLREEFEKTKGGISGLIQAMFNLDIQAQRTMATVAAAQALAAQASIDDANERARKVKNTRGPGQVFIKGKSISTVSNPEIKRYDAAVKAGRWNEAMSLASGSEAIRKARPSYTEIPAFVQDYQAAVSRKATAQTNQQMGEFFSSKAGATMSQGVQTVAQRSALAASTGKGKDAYLSAIDRQLDTLRNLAKTPGLNQGTLAGIGQLESLLVGARPGVAPEPAEEEKKKRERGGGSGRSPADRAKRDFLRVESDIAKEEAEWKKQVYENAVAALEEAPNLEALPDLMSDLNVSLTDWLTAEGEMALAAIEKSNATPEQKVRAFEIAGKKANELRIESIDKVADTLEGVIKKFIEVSTEAIERQYALATRGLDRELQLAQGRVQGLSNPVANQNTPDYMKTVVQRQADVAQDKFNRGSIGANDSRIAQYRAVAAKVSSERDQLNRDLERLGKIVETGTGENEIIVNAAKMTVARDRLKEIGEELLTIEDETYKLSLANDVLKASYDVFKDVPTTFGEGFAMALEAVKIDIGAASGLGQELIKNIDQPLRAVHEGFKGFFSDMVSGTASLSQAFKRMASSIIDSILEMVAVALANQFFSLLAGMFGPAPQASLVGSVSSTQAANPGLFWNGGQIKTGGSGTVTAKRMFAGGAVQNGLPTRDSTLVHAAKNEYMIREPAAQSLGKGFLDAINARGANALKGMGQTNVIAAPAAPTPVNVYVVAPEEKPTMGPNDVLATFSSDVLKGGVTKKLIQQVAAGG